MPYNIFVKNFNKFYCLYEKSLYFCIIILKQENIINLLKIQKK